MLHKRESNKIEHGSKTKETLIENKKIRKIGKDVHEDLVKDLGKILRDFTTEIMSVDMHRVIYVLKAANRIKDKTLALPAAVVQKLIAQSLQVSTCLLLVPRNCEFTFSQNE